MAGGDFNATDSHCERPEADKAFDRISWVIAISLAILAAVSNNLGVNLQKLAWTRKQANTPGVRYKALWVMGMLGIIMASVFDFVALAFGPQSVIAPLGSLTIVMNGCVAPVMHGEKVRRKIIWTSLIIVSGCAMAVATASHENVICDIPGIFAYFRSFTFLGYALVILFMSSSVAIFCKCAEKRFTEHGAGSVQYAKIFPYHRFSYAFLAGLFGAQSVVFARAIGQLVMSTSRGGQLFLVRWETWLILIALVAMIVVQMIYLNKGLAWFESSYNVPIFTATFIVGTAVSGGIVYGEFNGFSKVQSILFPLGVCLCILGVFLLAWGNDSDESEVESDRESDVVGEIPEQPKRKHSLSLLTPRSSLRLHSGGWTPFVIGIHDDQHHHGRHRKASLHLPSPLHHGRDLLTGLRAVDFSGPGTLFSHHHAHHPQDGASTKPDVEQGRRRLSAPPAFRKFIPGGRKGSALGLDDATKWKSSTSSISLSSNSSAALVAPAQVDLDIRTPLSPKNVSRENASQ